MRIRFQIWPMILVILAAPLGSRALGQGADVFMSAGEGTIETDDGLENATPGDDIDDLLDEGNFAGATVDSDDDFFGDEDDSNQQSTGDLFGNTSTSAFNAGDEATTPSAFDTIAGSLPAGNAPQNTATSSIMTLDPTVSAPPPGAVPPVDTSPTSDAELLMSELSQGELSQGGGVDANAASPAAPMTMDSSTAVMESTMDTPVIMAPPLPMPNEFAGAPPVPGTMRLMADGEAPEEYRVEPGDTLFDICDQLLDEPGYWPKLWALNPEIKNPHFIFPNMRLRFYPGDEETPPYLQVVSEDDIIPIDKGELDEQVLIAERVNFVDETQEDEIVEVIGPDQVDASEELEDTLLAGGRVYQGSDTQIQVPGFIFAEEREPVGRVIGGDAGGINIGPGQKALVESTGDIGAGTLYTVLRRGDDVHDPVSGDFVGYKYYFIASMRVTRRLEDGMYAGVVENSRLGVQPDDVLVSYISTNRVIPISDAVGALSSAEASIVGFDFNGQELGGSGHFAFVDRGTGAGISPGMYLPIYSTPGYLTMSFGQSDLPLNYEVVGVLRIIDATDAGAVGYIVKNSSEIRVGDRVGRG